MTVHAYPSGNRQGLDAVRDLVLNTVRHASHGTDLLAQLDLTRRAFDEFVAHDLEPAAASRAVASISRRLGEHHAHQQLDQDNVERRFSAVARAIQQRVLPNVCVPGLSTREVWTRVREYLQHILRDVLRGLTAAHQLMLRPLHVRICELLRALHDQESASLPTLVRSCGLDPTAPLRPIITRDASRWRSGLVGSPGVISSPASALALVTDARSLMEIEAMVDRPTAIGPITRVEGLAEAVRLTRLAAASSGPGHAHVERMVADLILTPADWLSDLLISTHLEALRDLSPGLRVRVATTLLAWLQTGRPLNAVARDLGQPRQTVHGHVQTARRLLGSTLDEPDQRLELIVALRLALRQWRPGT